MSDSTKDLILARINQDDHLVADPETRLVLQGMLRRGMRLPQAAEALDIPTNVAWRILAVDEDLQAAMVEGDRVNLIRRRSELENRAHRMLSVIEEIANDPDQTGGDRIKAAESLLDRSGLYPKDTGKGGSSTNVNVQVANVGREWEDRLDKVVTIRADTKNP
ncbi:MAG: hypothetical protein P1V36_00375 [Planctomycetota bacterium]|nr:hypothetical protein [Planctomycetota bacterium]